MTGRTYRRAVLGGTFDRLHAGHRALLRAAFARADEVWIGLTTSAYLRKHPKPLADRIEPFEVRRRNLGAYLRERFPGRRWRVVALADGFGGSIRPGPDLLVVSRETRAGGRAVNRRRQELGLAPLALATVAMTRDRSGRILRSRRRRALEVRAGARGRVSNP